MTRALENVRVIDLTLALAGPFCTQQLAVMGAEVIRIDPPWGGYVEAVFGAFPQDIKRRLIGPLYANKKNVTLNLKRERGKAIFLELVKNADVVVQNYAPGAMEKLGLSYEVLRETNPKVIYCAISGYGQNGPWSARPAYDPIIQAASGIMSINGFPDRGPLRVGVTISDYLGGLYAAVGILTALHARDTLTGEGQMIDCAMFDANLSVMQEAFALSLFHAKALPRSGNQYPLAVPAGTYPTSDGKLVFITCQADAQWNTFMSIMGRQDIIDRQWKLEVRVKHAAEVDEILESWTRTKTQQEIEETLLARDIPCAPVMDVMEVAGHPHTRAREMLGEVSDMFGKIDGFLGVTPKMLGTPGHQEWGLMELGAFNKDVYEGLLGMSEEDMTVLKEEGVI